MKKTILVLAGVASMLASVPAAQAAVTSPASFNVTVTLTSVCTMAAIGDLAFGTYLAFGPTKNATTTTATLTCTRGLLATGVTAAFDTTGGIGSTGATSAADAVGAGVLAGLQYDIKATQLSAVSGTAPTATFIGTGDSRPYTISGNMPASQAGDATAAATQVRTLTITY